MSVELDEVRDFLASHEPFSRLPEETLAQLPRQLSMRYIRRGETVMRRGQRNDHLHIIRSGAVDVVGSDGVLLDRVEAGRTFGYSTLVGEPESRYDIVTVEDCLVLVMAREVFEKLASEEEQLTRFYSSQSLRLRMASEEITRFADDASSGVLRQRIGEVVGQREVISVDSSLSIAETAATMAAHNVSSVLVMSEGELAGIITDKDLRARVVAVRRDVDDPVSDIMTTGLLTITEDKMVFEALLAMSEHGIHHLPVLDHGRVRGIVTAGDISRMLRSNPLYLTADIASQSRADLNGAFTRAAETTVRALGKSISSLDVSQVLTTVADAVVRRLVELAQEELGPAPVDWCFVAVGSQGRREMGPASDQDNALVLADDYDHAQHGEYFQRFTDYLCAGLADAGQALCPGNMMASNPEWRMTRSQWINTFHAWVGAPVADALLHAQIYFDMRPIAGTDALGEEVHAAAVAMSTKATRFHAHLASLAVHREPPIGFFRGFVVERGGEYASTLDIKRGGTAAVVQIARLYALSAGLSEISTRERLAAAAGQTVSESAARDLGDAFDYLTSLTLEHQSEQIAVGQPTDYHVDPKSLTAMQRENLRDAFSIVKKVQAALANTYPVRTT